MILGIIFKNEFALERRTNDFFLLLKHIEFSGSEVEIIDFSIGRIALVHHKELPKSEHDHCFISENLSVVFSGQLYNKSILAKELPASSNSTAELIANLYQEFGIEFIHKLNGDHAIVLIDHTISKTYFIKNQLGTVPISIAQKDEFIYFSSDTMGLSKGLFGTLKIDDTYLKSRFFDYEKNYQYTPHPQVRKVTPGHYLEIDSTHINEIKYWPKTPVRAVAKEFCEATTKLNQLVQDAVQIRCNSAYIAGSHISGGLDSSLVAHLTRKLYSNQKEFVGFTWSPKEYSAKNLAFDERVNINKQAQFSDLTIENTDFTVDDYDDFVKEWRCPSEFITEETIFKNAKSHGVNLIFSGWGGDEFIGVRDEGLYYESFIRFHWKDFYKLNRKKGLKSMIMHFVNSIILPTRRKIYFTLKINPNVFQFFKKSNLKNKNLDYTKKWYMTKTGYQIGLIEYYHLAQRCEDRYVHGQRNGIEYRYPLLDINIANYCLSLPVELFVGNEIDRPLIREICRNNLIDEIRLLSKTSDPVVMAASLSIQNEAVKAYKMELEAFRQNKYLSFIDFDLVEKAIKKSENSSVKLDKKLNYLIHQIKSTHEFTIHYHQ